MTIMKGRTENKMEEINSRLRANYVAAVGRVCIECEGEKAYVLLDDFEDFVHNFRSPFKITNKTFTLNNSAEEAKVREYLEAVLESIKHTVLDHKEDATKENS